MTRYVTRAVLALALALPLPAVAQTGGATRAEIEKMAQTWEKAYNAGDAAAVTALYTKDGKVMPPNAEPVTGSDGLKTYWAADIKGGAKMHLTTEDVTGSGNTVLETGKWVATAADGKHLDHGQYATFYKKEGGSWKIYRDIWNSSMAHK